MKQKPTSISETPVTSLSSMVEPVAIVGEAVKSEVLGDEFVELIVKLLQIYLSKRIKGSNFEHFLLEKQELFQKVENLVSIRETSVRVGIIWFLPVHYINIHSIK